MSRGVLEQGFQIVLKQASGAGRVGGCDKNVSLTTFEKKRVHFR